MTAYPNITIVQGQTYYLTPFTIDGDWTGGTCRGHIRDKYLYLGGQVLAAFQFEALAYDGVSQKTTVTAYIDYQHTSLIAPTKWKGTGLQNEKNSYVYDIEVEKDGKVSKKAAGFVGVLPEVTNDAQVYEPPIIWDGGINNIELTETNGLIKTYTVWGDADQSINLGTFNVSDGEQGIQGIQGIPGDSFTPNYTVVNSKSDLPTAINGVITLSAGAYNICGNIDLLGDRLVCDGIVTLFGTSSENASIVSTGLNGDNPLIYSEYTLPIRNLSITAEYAIHINGDGVSDVAIDWIALNFVDCPKVGIINNATNFVYKFSAFINAADLLFTGTIGTIAIEGSLLNGYAAKTILRFADTLTIQRRFRAIYSSIIALSGETAIDFNVLTTVPPEGYILDTIAFTGGGTYLAGVQPTDNKAKFTNCSGVINSVSVANLYLKNNAVATDVLVQGARYPVAGVSQVSAIIQRFEHDLANNALTYTSTISRVFKILCTFSLIAPSNNVIGVYIGINRSGNAIDATADRVSESEVYVTASGSRPDASSVQCLATLNEGDRVYMIVQNQTGTGDITVQFMNLIVETSPT